MQAHLYAAMLRSRLVTCSGVVLASRGTRRPRAAVRGRRIRILRTGVLPLRSGGGAGRRRLERIVVLTPFPGLELRLLQENKRGGGVKLYCTGGFGGGGGAVR